MHHLMISIRVIKRKKEYNDFIENLEYILLYNLKNYIYFLITKKNKDKFYKSYYSFNIRIKILLNSKTI